MCAFHICKMHPNIDGRDKYSNLIGFYVKRNIFVLCTKHLKSFTFLHEVTINNNGLDL